MKLGENEMLKLLYPLRMAYEKVLIAYYSDEYKDEAHEAMENLKKVLGEIE